MIRSHLGLLLALGATLTLGCIDDGDDGDGGDGASGPVDTDGDGLTDDEEAELGLDPSSDDTDGDGFGDKDEIDGGTDPSLCWSVPEGAWPDCRAQAENDDIDPEGWSLDEVVEDWTFVDQFGDDVDFYQFYGMVVLVDMAAGWCGPCRQAAEDAEELYQEYKDEGVVFVQIMIDDNSYDGVVSDDDFASEWAEEYDLTFPVGTDDSVNGYAAPYYNLSVEGYIEGVPHFAVYDREMVLDSTWSGFSEAYVRSAIEDAM